MDPAVLAPLLAGGRAVAIDGGLATQLEAQGNDLADPLWSARLLVERPAEIVAAHLAFFRAGARIAISASYQATVEGFVRRGLDRASASARIRSSVELADEARRAYREERGPEGTGPLLVAASIGPYGASRADGSEYRGRYGLSVDALRDFHRERLALLADSGADLLACETIPELEEGIALVELLEERGYAVGWLSFSCADGARLRSGAPVEEAFALANATTRVVAVGVNCTAPEHVDELIGRARSATDRPVVVYPNSGEVWDTAARRWVGGPGVTVDGAAAARWETAGAALIGGCCRVGPAAISEVAAALGA